MVKFTASSSDGRRKLIGFGITNGNIRKLRKGQPIHVAGEEIGVPGLDFTIFWGRDEAQLEREMRPFIGPDTHVTDSRQEDKH